MVVVQLIHRLTQAGISCTTMARLFVFPMFAKEGVGNHCFLINLTYRVTMVVVGDMSLVMIIPLSARFCLGRWGFGYKTGYKL